MYNLLLISTVVAVAIATGFSGAELPSYLLRTNENLRASI